MPKLCKKNFRWFIVTLTFLFGFVILSSLAEDLGGNDIVKLVDNDKSSQDEKNNEQNSTLEEVVELEGSDFSEGTSDVQNPDQVYEACMSLKESFEKECSKEKVNEPLSDLVEACNDAVLNIQRVTSVASGIVQNSSNPNFSESTECSVMIYTTSLYISSNSRAEEEDEDGGSIEAESLETEESNMESEFEKN